MTLMELKELASIIQSLALAVAVLVGGGWALYRYFSLRSIQRARAELEKTRVEIERARRSLQERGVIEIDIVAEQMFLDGNYLISVCGNIKNTGNSTELIDYPSISMEARKVICSSDGSVDFSAESFIGKQPRKIIDFSLAPGEVVGHSFIIRVPDCGVYHIRYEATCSLQATNIALAERGQAVTEDSGPMVWGGSIFFQVKDMEE